jgi:hypothetical protein
VEVAGAAPMTPTALAALQLEVPTVSATLQLEIPPAARVESTIKAVRIHHQEVPTTSVALQLQVPTAPTT